MTVLLLELKFFLVSDSICLPVSLFKKEKAVGAVAQSFLKTCWLCVLY